MILSWVILGIVLLWAAWQDSRMHQISILATGGGITVGFVLHTILIGWHGLLASVSGAVIGGLLGVLLWKLASMGEGDVLLYMAIGSLVGPVGVVFSFFTSNVLVLLLTLPEVLHLRAKRRHPLGPWIAAGTVIAGIGLKVMGV